MCALVTGVQTCALPVCSLFRLQRDTCFASDKSPYKGWQGARLFHYRRRELAAPSFYIHLEPGECFVGAELWHPETHTQSKVRQFIFENPGGWAAAARSEARRVGKGCVRTGRTRWLPDH